MDCKRSTAHQHEKRPFEIKEATGHLHLHILVRHIDGERFLVQLVDDNQKHSLVVFQIHTHEEKDSRSMKELVTDGEEN